MTEEQIAEARAVIAGAKVVGGQMSVTIIGMAATNPETGWSTALDEIERLTSHLREADSRCEQLARRVTEQNRRIERYEKANAG